MSSNVIECIHKIADGPEITPSNTNSVLKLCRHSMIGYFLIFRIGVYACKQLIRTSLKIPNSQGTGSGNLRQQCLA